MKEKVYIQEFICNIIGKISAFTAMQYLNHINNKPIERVKYTLA